MGAVKSMEIVTGSTPQAHVTPIDDAIANSNIGYLHDRVVFAVYDNFAAQDTSTNTIRISSGYGMMQGRLFKIPANTYEDVSIDNGSAGVKRMDLIVARYSVDPQTSHEDISLAVIKGTSGADYTEPQHEESDINNGGTIDEFVLYKVYIDGISIDHIERAFTLLPEGGRLGHVEEVIDALPKDVGDLAGKTYVDAQIEQLQTNFRDGVDTIAGAVNAALTAQGENPLAASTPTAVAAGIGALTDIKFDVTCKAGGSGTTKVSLSTDMQGATSVEVYAQVEYDANVTPTPPICTYYGVDASGEPVTEIVPIDQILWTSRLGGDGKYRTNYKAITISLDSLAADMIDRVITVECTPNSAQITYLYIEKHCVTRKTYNGVI